jgi:arginase
MSGVRVIAVPYHLGRQDRLLGAGPARILQELPDVAAVRVKRARAFDNEIRSSFHVVRKTARAVREALEAGDFPLVIAGNCHTAALGQLTGLGEQVGVIWFDAHADVNTPETSPTGFLDGMALAMVVGEGWSALRDGLATVPADRVALVGARDLDPSEESFLARTRIRRDDLSLPVESVYLHIDLDVLDPSEGRANAWAAPGGLSVAELERAVDEVSKRYDVRAASITAYDPKVDRRGRIARIAASLVRRLTTSEVPA